MTRPEAEPAAKAAGFPDSLGNPDLFSQVSEILTVREVATLLRLTEQTVRKLVHAGSLQATNTSTGKRPTWRITPEAVHAWTQKTCASPGGAIRDLRALAHRCASQGEEGVAAADVSAKSSRPLPQRSRRRIEGWAMLSGALDPPRVMIPSPSDPPSATAPVQPLGRHALVEAVAEMVSGDARLVALRVVAIGEAVPAAHVGQMAYCAAERLLKLPGMPAHMALVAHADLSFDA